MIRLNVLSHDINQFIDETMVIAYLRVSTEKQFLANQKAEIQQFAMRHELKIDKWYTETVSGTVNKRERKLSALLRQAQPGDILIVTEVSRLSRTLLEIMSILNICIKKNVVLYSTKEGYVFQNDINSKVLGFAFGLMAELERNLISLRTREALDRRKKEGMILGRPFGFRPKMKVLMENRAYLMRAIGQGATHTAMAKQFGVSRSTMFRFLKECC